MTGEVVIQVVSIGPHTGECERMGAKGVCEGWRVDVRRKERVCACVMARVHNNKSVQFHAV